MLWFNKGNLKMSTFFSLALMESLHSRLSLFILSLSCAHPQNKEKKIFPLTHPTSFIPCSRPDKNGQASRFFLLVLWQTIETEVYPWSCPAFNKKSSNCTVTFFQTKRERSSHPQTDDGKKLKLLVFLQHKKCFSLPIWWARIKDNCNAALKKRTCHSIQAK